MKNEDLYTLKLHESGLIDSQLLDTQITRVPGGWIYTFFDRAHHLAGSTFVPWNNEFQEPEMFEAPAGDTQFLKPEEFPGNKPSATFSAGFGVGFQRGKQIKSEQIEKAKQALIEVPLNPSYSTHEDWVGYGYMCKKAIEQALKELVLK